MVRHAFGHNIGLEVHERPFLASAERDSRLEPGNVVTLEPGVYEEGVGGVRFEDMYLITSDGYTPLTSSVASQLNVPPPYDVEPSSSDLMHRRPDKVPQYVDVDLLDAHGRFLIGDDA
jgi:hypothetical protein